MGLEDVRPEMGPIWFGWFFMGLNDGAGRFGTLPEAVSGGWVRVGDKGLDGSAVADWLSKDLIRLCTPGEFSPLRRLYASRREVKLLSTLVRATFWRSPAASRMAEDVADTVDARRLRS